MAKSKSEIEELLYKQIKIVGLPLPKREYRFVRDIVGDGAGIRKRVKEAGLHDWKFDFAYPQYRLAIEVEGGTWSGGRHVRGAGYKSDCQKYNAAQLHGWIVLRYTTDSIKDGSAMDEIEKTLERMGAQGK